ncbi:sulfite exporter TauE/SafE family protein [Tenacibaculum maritimum]|uniref:Probable membrane transporter protein n=1 Tax=Tenacibaculum maritimum NCIMB 2154 TaxID=1349785 RepID=A0A2H1E9B1_9FLAO|nr:sulfite exporter TauE/SafE family protein [Tenacibaculum maritimum]MCD9584548.1 sulfite exporter TauE/SafE family protein [Tenacibaculum maritimum]MCD9620971.1 sulfite exporter TauE/SafE family protein [Tenacibaculum maritimum]MCD9627177.1 sulfite exporter TauE/SafE family protein [Tenacibaculum maritimum]MCD9629747.1 sulfite exporter TauE/SafE family protein [Tenacibaculum maritimum]MCD9632792.1 sulfite exporter TauE/SafE family protein [Tenacibaculum maritimum]
MILSYAHLLDILTIHWHVVLFFFIIAALYSSVGFGGGSSYLAILSLTGIAYIEIRSIALLCNIIVVTGNVILFHRQQCYNWSKILPLVLFSVPMAFMGGYLKVNQTFFFILLGITLLFASITMWLSKKEFNKYANSPLSFVKNASYGSCIGFISGMVGIGGGIFLAPLLHLTNWDSSKKIAATASFFILVNSLSGLAGQYANPLFKINWDLTIILLMTVFMGGQIGSRTGSFFTSTQLKRATAILIASVSMKILWKYL